MMMFSREFPGEYCLCVKIIKNKIGSNLEARHEKKFYRVGSAFLLDYCVRILFGIHRSVDIQIELKL